MSFILVITTVDLNAKPIQRTFLDRAQAQGEIDSLYMRRVISHQEWERLFNMLSIVDSNGLCLVLSGRQKALADSKPAAAAA